MTQISILVRVSGSGFFWGLLAAAGRPLHADLPLPHPEVWGQAAVSARGSSAPPAPQETSGKVWSRFGLYAWGISYRHLVGGGQECAKRLTVPRTFPVTDMIGPQIQLRGGKTLG